MDKPTLLVEILSPYFDKPGHPPNILPDDVQGMIRRIFIQTPFGPGYWMDLSPDERRRVVIEWDKEHAPAKAKEHSYWFNLESRINDVSREIEECQLRNHQGLPSEARIQAEDISALRTELAKLVCRREPPPFSDTTLKVSPTYTPAGLQSPTDAKPMRHKLRTNSLDGPIRKAIGQANNLETGSVWLQLKELALQCEPPFTGQVEGSVLCYTNDDNKPDKLSKEALRKRLKNHVL